LQALTFWTLKIKKTLGSSFEYKNNQKIKPAKFFSQWFVLFVSKFIFLWVIDVLFGENVNISGFISLLVIILVMTIIKQVLLFADTKFDSKN
jgi:hypothetical protein